MPKKNKNKGTPPRKAPVMCFHENACIFDKKEVNYLV
jgi:hypothetical protein